MKKNIYITLPGILRAIFTQNIRAIKNKYSVIMQYSIQKKFIILVFFAVLFLVAIPLDISQQINTDTLIRIHVLGNSNSELDQALKITVKDAVVAYLTPQLEASQSLAESRAIIQNNMSQIAQVANETLFQQGCTDTVTLQYGHFDFPLRHYSGFSLPAGNYEALRILIGEAKGCNWWCVLFPPLCFTDRAAAENTTSSGSHINTLPKEELVIKWRGKELWNDWTGKITNHD